ALGEAGSSIRRWSVRTRADRPASRVPPARQPRRRGAYSAMTRTGARGGRRSVRRLPCSRPVHRPVISIGLWASVPGAAAGSCSPSAYSSEMRRTELSVTPRRKRRPLASTMTAADERPIGARATTRNSPLPSPRPFRSQVRSRRGATITSASAGSSRPRTSPPSIRILLGQNERPVSWTLDDLGDPNAEFVVDDHHVASGYERPVDDDIHRGAGGPVQVDHGPFLETQQVADLH